MKKILLALGLVFLVSCGQSDTKSISTGGTDGEYAQIIASSSPKITQTEAFSNCMTPYVNICIQSTASELVTQTKDASICTELRTPEEQTACQFWVIMQNISPVSSLETCDQVTDKDLQTVCKKTIFERQAVAKKNVDDCQAIASLYTNEEDKEQNVESCMATIITSKTDLTDKDCARFKDPANLAFCQNVVTQINIANQNKSNSWAEIESSDEEEVLIKDIQK